MTAREEQLRAIAEEIGIVALAITTEGGIAEQGQRWKLADYLRRLEGRLADAAEEIGAEALAKAAE